MTEPPRRPVPPVPSEWGPAPRRAPADRRFQPPAADHEEDDDEPMGGDPACWAHLFEDEAEDAR